MSVLAPPDDRVAPDEKDPGFRTYLKPVSKTPFFLGGFFGRSANGFVCRLPIPAVGVEVGFRVGVGVGLRHLRRLIATPRHGRIPANLQQACGLGLGRWRW